MIKESAFYKKAKAKEQTFKEQEKTIVATIATLETKKAELEHLKAQYVMDSDPVEFQNVCTQIRDTENQIADLNEYLENSKGCPCTEDEIIAEWGTYIADIRKPYDKLIKEFDDIKKQMAKKYVEIKQMEKQFDDDRIELAGFAEKPQIVVACTDYPQINNTITQPRIKDLIYEEIIAIQSDFFDHF